MEPGLQALLLCDDDKVVRVLRRVLNELEIGVEHCLDPDTAVQRITRQRFEAVVVDCANQDVASRVLKATRSAPANKRAIVVALVDSQSALGGTFAQGAHFVLYKPLALERTKANFKSVRALMKRERRRHARVPLELQVEIVPPGNTGAIHTVSIDLAENGIAVRSKGYKLPPAFQVRFTLPALESQLECPVRMHERVNELLNPLLL